MTLLTASTPRTTRRSRQAGGGTPAPARGRSKSPAAATPASEKKAAAAATPKRSVSRGRSKTPAAKPSSTNNAKTSSTSELEKIQAFEKAFKPKVPAMLNCTPDGFTPGPILSFFPCAAANLDYWAADLIVYPCYRIGLNSPNKITSLNCVLRVYLLYDFFFIRNYPLVTLLLAFAQILDCADGQMARRYKMGSEFGAWYDHFSDEMFGYAFAATTFRIIATTNEGGVRSPAFATFFLIIAAMGVGGKSVMYTKENDVKWKDFKPWHVWGMVQELYMTYIYALLVGSFAYVGWLPAAN